MTLSETLRKKTRHLRKVVYGDRTDVGVDEDLDPHDDLLSYIEALDERQTEMTQQLAEIESQLEAIQDLGREKTTKEEKVAAIVQYAQNTATNPETDRVAVKAREIKGVAGVSRRYAYDLVDDLPGEYEWIHDRSAVQQYGDLEIDRETQVRAVVVDLEQLHSDTGAVNKFTTRSSREEASA